MVERCRDSCLKLSGSRKCAQRDPGRVRASLPQRLPSCLGHRLFLLLASWRPQDSLVVCNELWSQQLLLSTHRNVYTLTCTAYLRPGKQYRSDSKNKRNKQTHTVHRCRYLLNRVVAHCVCAHTRDDEQPFGARIIEAANKATMSHNLIKLFCFFAFLSLSRHLLVDSTHSVAYISLPKKGKRQIDR